MHWEKLWWHWYNLFWHKCNLINNKDKNSLNNFQVNQTIETSIDLTKRDLLGGGADQLPPGKNDIGKYSSNLKRDTKNITNINSKSLISNNYILICWNILLQ